MSEVHTLQVSRTARYHVLGACEGAREAWVVLHGYGQLARPFLESFAPLASPQRLWIAPEGLSRFYLRRGTGEVGASWMTREARADEIADTVGYLDRLAEHVLGPRLGEIALHVLGFSQGGAAAARWALLGRTNVESVTLWGCPFPPDLELGRDPQRARRVRWTFALGDQDDSVDRDAVEQGVQRLRASGLEPGWLRFSGGHELVLGVVEQLAGGG